jgi:hypothetical protein
LNVQIKNLLKYSSLFTPPSQTPINRAFGEVKRFCNSSPLFTTLHPLFLSGQEGTVLSAHRTQAEIGGLVIGFAGFLLYG